MTTPWKHLVGCVCGGGCVQIAMAFSRSTAIKRSSFHFNQRNLQNKVKLLENKN